MGFSSAFSPIGVFPTISSSSSSTAIFTWNSTAPVTHLYFLATPNSCHVSRKTAPRWSIRGRGRTRGFHGVRMSAVELEPSLVVKQKAAEISELLKGTSIFLVGLSGSMKAHVGKVLANALRYYYFDSDSLVVQAAGGVSDAESFRERDENGFRDSETEVLKQLSSMGRLVVCTGDSAVQSSTNLALLRYGILIRIDVPLDMLAEEMLKSSSQCSPTQAVRPTDTFDELLDKLNKHYEEAKNGYATADATVSLLNVASQLGYDELDTVTPEDMALEALKQIEKLTRMKKMLEESARPF